MVLRAGKNLVKLNLNRDGHPECFHAGDRAILNPHALAGLWE
jgi:hypothetical protein